MRHAVSLPLVLVAMTAPIAGQVAEPRPGISQELAEARERSIRDVKYQLSFMLSEGMKAVSGACKVRFSLIGKVVAPVVIDFGGESIKNIKVNGEGRAHLRRVHNHLVIPKSALVTGENVLEAEFTSKVAPTGTPLTVYKDRTDGQEYYYTLVVPADAHRLFPCFDQPGLKGTYSLVLSAPAGWSIQAIGNGKQKQHRILEVSKGADVQLWEFEATRPLPTYLFAFAAGPFVEIKGKTPLKVGGRDVPVRMFLRKSKIKEVETEKLFQMHRRSVKWLSDYFGYDYPFTKLDFVLTPGFPYGGMEHAGAIFYRESALVFDHQPTQSELTRRSTLIYHEVSHQWFGNLVTMKWFDDLWLKEGFATFMGYTLLETLEPGKKAWLRFHQRVKPRAYSVDATSGTTPVYQKLKNLADAKSAYGAIVYNKAPAVIRELNARLGAPVFQKGLQAFLKKHAFANATWQDLVKALEGAAKTSAAHWSNRWILAAGMPRVRVHWTSKDNKIASCEIRQESLQGDKGVWPLRLEVLMIDANGSHRTTKIVTDKAVTKVESLIGQRAPRCILLNPEDVAYGQFLLDKKSRDYLVDHAHRIRSPLLRAVAMSALYATLREADLAPERYLMVARQLLAEETDPESHAWLLGTVGTTLRRYLTPDKRTSLANEFRELLLLDLQGPKQAIKLQSLRFLLRLRPEGQLLEIAQKIVRGEQPIEGLKIGTRDRFLAAASLIATGAGEQPIEQLKKRFAGEDLAKEAFVAGAAEPDKATKEKYFKAYLNLDEPPEQWTSASLGYFHWTGQEEITLPYLRKALDQLEWVKKNRKIFFMPAWLDAFVNGHSSKEALEIVNTFLKDRPDLSPDIRLKLLQSLDGLQRAVKIKERWN